MDKLERKKNLVPKVFKEKKFRHVFSLILKEYTPPPTPPCSRWLAPVYDSRGPTGPFFIKAGWNTAFYNFAAIVFELCTYIDDVLKVYKHRQF